MITFVECSEKKNAHGPHKLGCPTLRLSNGCELANLSHYDSIIHLLVDSVLRCEVDNNVACLKKYTFKLTFWKWSHPIGNQKDLTAKMETR